MKFNKQLIIILVLGSLLMSALGAALYFYKQHQTTLAESNMKVKVYIAKEKLPRNKQIEKTDIREHFLTKQEVLNRPLNIKEIVGKYVSTPIYKNEIFIKEKISDKLPEDTDKKFLDYKNNSYNMAFKLFKNPNYTLEKGDYIHILTAYQSSTDKLPKFSSQYIAKDVKVLGFIEKGQPVAKAVNVKKIKKKVKKKEVEVVEAVKADEIVLDLKNKVVLDIAEDFNKKKSLYWMTKTKSKTVAKVVKKPKTTSTKTKKKVIKRSYPVQWYIPKTIYRGTEATIAYADRPADSPTVQKATIKYDYEQACQQTDKLLIGISRNVYLKSRPSLRAKTLKKVYRNYIIAYKEKSGNWYKTCDNKYVHQNEARPISKQLALEKMKKK